jgi:hypothetical protein
MKKAITKARTSQTAVAYTATWWTMIAGAIVNRTCLRGHRRSGVERWRSRRCGRPTSQQQRVARKALMERLRGKRQIFKFKIQIGREEYF